VAVSLTVSTQYMNMTDRQTDTQAAARHRTTAYAQHRAAITNVQLFMCRFIFTPVKVKVKVRTLVIAPLT